MDVEALPSLKLTAKASENEWLEDSISFGALDFFSNAELLVLQGV